MAEEEGKDLKSAEKAEDMDEKEALDSDKSDKNSEQHDYLPLVVFLAVTAILTIAIVYFAFFNTKTLDIMLLGPNTGAWENSIRIIDDKIILQGADYDSLRNGGDRIVLIAMNISSVEGLDITLQENGNYQLDYNGILYDFSSEIGSALNYTAYDEAGIRNLLEGTEAVNIIFDGSSPQDNSYFTVVSFNTVSKLKRYYLSIGRDIKFSAMDTGTKK